MRFSKILAWAAVLGLRYTGMVCAQDPGWKGVITVGAGDNCTARSLTSAVNVRKTDPGYLPIIWVSNDFHQDFFDGSTIALDNISLEIIGGFDDCNDVTPSGYTPISGRGSSARPVFTITGASRVWLAHLEIVEGDSNQDGEGGGISFTGGGELNLEHLHLLNNRAGHGAGLFARGTTDAANRLMINVNDDVVIADNTANRTGGGIHVEGYTQLNMRGMHLALHRNHAPGVGGDDGQGGGLYVKAPARAGVSAAPFPGYPVFWDNDARRGGGIAATGWSTNSNDSYVNLSTHPNGEPMMLGTNRASVAGGAIYIGGNNGSIGEVCANDTIFRHNVAPEGAAVYATRAGTGLQGRFTTNDPTCGSNPYRCPGNRNCSWFDGNRTEQPDGTRTEGSIIEFPGAEGALTLHRTRFTGNTAGTLIHVGDDEYNYLVIDNTLLAGNDVSRHVIDTDARESHLRHLTIAGNTRVGPYVLRLKESSDSSTNSLSTITNSIIFEPGHLTLEHEGAREQTVIQYIASNDSSTLPQNDPTVIVANPLFSDTSQGDYLPRYDSVVVDFAPKNIPGEENDDFAYDLLGRTRTVYLDSNDPSFPRDLGCYEIQGAPVLRVFASGFE